MKPIKLFTLNLNTDKGDGAIKDLIESTAKALIDYPEQVGVSEIEGSQTSVIELKVAKENL